MRNEDGGGSRDQSLSLSSIGTDRSGKYSIICKIIHEIRHATDTKQILEACKKRSTRLFYEIARPSLLVAAGTRIGIRRITLQQLQPFSQ